MRPLTEDVSAAVEVAAPAAGRDPGGSLLTVHDGVDEAPEDVEVVWDPARAVVWRNAPGTYVADHVRAFSVGFVLRDGRSVEGVAMRAADWRGVRAVRVAVAIEVGSALVRRDVAVRLGSL